MQSLYYEMEIVFGKMWQISGETSISVGISHQGPGNDPNSPQTLIILLDYQRFFPSFRSPWREDEHAGWERRNEQICSEQKLRNMTREYKLESELLHDSARV